MTTTDFKNYTVKNFADRTDIDGCLQLNVSSDRPIPNAVYEGKVTVTEAETGIVWLVNVVDFNDCYRNGGLPSFIWVEIVGSFDLPHAADDPRHLTSDRF